MTSTDHLMLGFQEGVCVASAWRQEGPGAKRFNAETVTGWLNKGWDVRTLHKSDPAAKAAHDEMYENARKAADAYRAAKGEPA